MISFRTRLPALSYEALRWWSPLARRISLGHAHLPGPRRPRRWPPAAATDGAAEDMYLKRGLRMPPRRPDLLLLSRVVQVDPQDEVSPDCHAHPSLRSHLQHLPLKLRVVRRHSEGDRAPIERAVRWRASRTRRSHSCAVCLHCRCT